MSTPPKAMSTGRAESAATVMVVRYQAPAS